jgi:membrane protease YdiL (CAAX protease family)
MMGSKKQLVLFLCITWSISWPVWILSGVLGRGADATYDLQWWVAQVGVFAPSLSAITLSAFRSVDLRKNSLRLLLLLVLILALGTVITLNSPHAIRDFTPTTSVVVLIIALASLVFFSPWNHLLLNPATGDIQRRGNGRWIILTTCGMPIVFLLSWLIAGNSGTGWSISSLDNGLPKFFILLILCFCMNLNYGGSMGEELGWRGFCLPLLLKIYHPVKASVILGLIQAAWHLPIDITSSDIPALMVLFRIAWAIPITIIFTWVYLNSPANLLTALLLHTSVNVLPDVGFSNYERTMFLFVLFVVILSSIVARTPLMQSKERA